MPGIAGVRGSATMATFVVLTGISFGNHITSDTRHLDDTTASIYHVSKIAKS